MPQRFLRSEDVAAQLFIDPVREGLAHAVGGDLAGQLVRFDGFLQDSVKLDPAKRPPPLAAGEEVVAGGQDRVLGKRVDPVGQGGLRLS